MATMRWTRKVENAPWSGRSNHFCVSFNGLIWLYGGAATSNIRFTIYTGVTDMQREIWSSPDGVTWTFRGYLPFYFVSVYDEWTRGSGAVFENKIVLTMSHEDGNDPPFRSEVWSSSDGVNFVQDFKRNGGTQEIGTASPASLFQFLQCSGSEYQGQLYFAQTRFGTSQSIWRSPNRSDWSGLSHLFQMRTYLHSIGGSLYACDHVVKLQSISGGSVPTSPPYLKWNPSFGFTWAVVNTPVEMEAPTRRHTAQCLVDGNIYVHGGANFSTTITNPFVLRSDLWRGIGGEAYEEVEQVFTAGSIGNRAAHSMVFHGGKFYLIGGSSSINISGSGSTILRTVTPVHNDVWEGVLVSGSGAGGNGGIVPEFERSSLLPGATARVSHARRLRSYRSLGQAESFHNAMRGV